MKRATGLKVLIVFLLSLCLVGGAAWYSYKRLNEMVVTVYETSRPDRTESVINQLLTDIRSAENGVRAYALTKDGKFLEPFYEFAASFEDRLDTLSIIASEMDHSQSDVDSLSMLLRKKLDVYEKLLAIRYGDVVKQAFSQIKIEIPPAEIFPADSVIVAEEKKSFFKRALSIFNKKKDKPPAPDTISFQETIIEQLQKNIEAARDTSEKQMAALTASELNLLSTDKKLSERINTILVLLRQHVLENNAVKAMNARNLVEQTVFFIRVFCIIGASLILLFIIAILRDLVQSRRYRDELITAKQHAEELANAKEDFLANMSHEIRTPLSAIKGFNELMHKTPLDEKQKYYLHAISSSSEHLLSLVNDLLDTAKIDSGDFKFDKTNFTPSGTIADVHTALLQRAKEKGLNFEINTNRISGIILSGDPVRLKQIIFNLAGNAIKFTDKGSVKIDCWWNSYSEQHGRLQVQVEDTGPGIAKEQQEKIFARFGQAESEKKYSGTGLGLSISQRLVQMQQGEITLHSEAGKGSLFTVTIPYEQAQPEARAVEGNHDDYKELLNGLTVLLAEDDEWNRVLMQKFLTGFGITAHMVSTGKEAVLHAQKKKYDIVLLDYQLPEMNGRDAAVSIKKESLNTATPVIVVTANVMNSLGDLPHKNIFDDYLLKPFNEKELGEKLLKHSGMKRQSRGETRDGEQASPEAEDISQKSAPPDSYREAIGVRSQNNNAAIIFNLSSLSDTAMGNKDFLLHMLTLYLRSTESNLRLMKDAIHSGNAEETAAIAHKMIPPSRQIEADTVVDLLKKIESSSRSSQLNKSKELFDRLEKHSSLLLQQLEIETEKIKNANYPIT